MTYSKTHFRQIAAVISQFADEIPQSTFEDLVEEFSDLFRAYNPLFDEIKFAEACAPTLGA